MLVSIKIHTFVCRVFEALLRLACMPCPCFVLTAGASGSSTISGQSQPSRPSKLSRWLVRRGAFRWPHRLRPNSKFRYSVTSEPSRHDDNNNNSSSLLDLNKYKITTDRTDHAPAAAEGVGYEERAVDVGDDISTLLDTYPQQRACLYLTCLFTKKIPFIK